MSNRLLTLIIFSLGISVLTAQTVDLTPDRFAFEPALEYDAAIQSPAAFLGYELGERFVEYEKSVQYYRYLAEASDRITIKQYGTTYEQRPLFSLVVTSTNNHARMDELRQRHLNLLNPKFAASAEGQDIVANDPVFTLLSYNIHGNEPSTAEAAMQVAYRLAATNDQATLDALENSVLILFMCINPDGRDRYVYWANGASRSVPAINPRDLTHYEPWPNGRTNHYWFDLNRDWLWGVHPESRGHIAEYQSWMPQVHADYHEQGYNANYFTVPGATPRNLLLPDAYDDWADIFGRENVNAFDEKGMMYFTRERFDFFYPGYGSSYPNIMGAIGMLTEQGGIGAGLAVETNDGYVLTFRQRIWDHYTTSMATFFKAAEQRKALLQYSVDAWNPTKSKSPHKAYIIRQEDGGFTKDFLAVMLRQGISVQRATQDFKVANSLEYRTGKRGSQSFAAGDYLIDANQARHLFLHSMLARNMEIEDSVMYDMSTWAAPLAYNLETYAAPTLPGVATEPVTKQETSWTGQVVTPKSPNRTPYAYLIDWQQRWAPKALSLLWEKGYRVRSASEPFSDGTTEFAAGSLIVLRGRNLEKAADMVSDMEELAQTTGVQIYTLTTGRMETGYD
ncbi:MAG: M14 family zinc carboxypeptidase, partial [Bacteroidota bacterium]